MKQKNILLTLLMLILMCMIIGCSKEIKKVELNANWTSEGQHDTFEESYENTGLVMIGKVNSVKSFKRHEMVFSHASVDVIKVIKGDFKENINILFTGGIIDDTEYVLEPLKIAEEKDVYLFLLQLSGIEENEYVTMGGYQGIFKIKDDASDNLTDEDINKLKFEKFNSGNKLEDTILGDNIMEKINSIK